MDDFSLVMLRIVMMMVPFLLSLTIHETAHAWTADKLGDPTARLMGRINLNPLAHADPIGTFVFPIIGAISGFMFGWAKPVPVNPINLKDYRRDVFWISLAGPLSNFILAFILTFLFVLFFRFRNLIPQEIFTPLAQMMDFGIVINLALCFFNLIPLGPLDGAKILNRFLPEQAAQVLERFSAHGMMILMLMMFAGLLGGIIAPPMYFFANLFKQLAITVIM
jgi:Zn-dependent protease